MKKKSILNKLQDQINLFEKDLSQLDSFLKAHYKGTCSETKTLSQIMLLNKKYPLNPLILIRLLSFLQLSSEERVLNSFSMDDMGRVYQQLANSFKNDLEINIENFYFVYNVQDKEAKALKLLEKFKKRVEKTIPVKGKDFD